MLHVVPGHASDRLDLLGQLRACDLFGLRRPTEPSRSKTSIAPTRARTSVTCTWARCFLPQSGQVNVVQFSRVAPSGGIEQRGLDLLQGRCGRPREQGPNLSWA